MITAYNKFIKELDDELSIVEATDPIVEILARLPQYSLMG